jgi:hypothetical protein
MKRFAIFVATTEGPVRVERITRERAPQSMVCLNRSSTVLPISAAYDSFVRPGSGVIERTFGPFEPGAFRLDVSAPIETGESWQLGFFVAHALCASPNGGLLESPDQADAVLWITGLVDCDLGVGPVGHLAEKMHASRGPMSAWRESGRPVSLFVPDGADHDALFAAGVPAGAQVIPVRSASDVLSALGLVTASPVPPKNTLPAYPATVKRAPARLLAGGFVVSAAAAFALSQWSGAPPSASEHLEALKTPLSAVAPVIVVSLPPAAAAPLAATPEPHTDATPATVPAASGPNILIVERRAPAGRTCAEVQFGSVAAVEVPVTPAETEPGSSVLRGLCGLGVAVDNGDQPRFVAVNVDAVTGKLLYGTVRPDLFGGQTAFGGRHEWAIDLPRRLPGPFEIRVTAISGLQPVTASNDTDPQPVAPVVLRHRVLP